MAIQFIKSVPSCYGPVFMLGLPDRCNCICCVTLFLLLIFSYVHHSLFSGRVCKEKFCSTGPAGAKICFCLFCTWKFHSCLIKWLINYLSYTITVAWSFLPSFLFFFYSMIHWSQVAGSWLKI